MLSEEEIEALKASFQPVKPIQAKGAEAFFANLLEAYPHMEGPFHVAGKKPEAMLWATVELIVENASDIAGLSMPFTNLGARHVSLGAKEADYGKFADILIGTIAAANGDDWTETAEDAWEKALGQVVDFMVAGAEDARRDAA